VGVEPSVKQSAELLDASSNKRKEKGTRGAISPWVIEFNWCRDEHPVREGKRNG